MENKQLLKRFLTEKAKYLAYIGIVLIIILARIIPHIPNFTPMTALALFSGSSTRNNNKFFLLPIIAMFVSDLLIGLHSTIPFVYFSFLIIAIIGRFFLIKTTVPKLLTISLLSSIVFFLITNFGVWLTSTMYVKNFNGLISAYIMGIPFLRNMVIGDIVYSLSCFYGYWIFSNLLEKEPHKLKT